MIKLSCIYLTFKQLNNGNIAKFFNARVFQSTQQILFIMSFLFCAPSSLAAQTAKAENIEKSFNLVAAIYPPYNYQDGEIKGLNIEVIKAAFSAVNYKVKVEILPFGRAFQYAKQGIVDGIPLWYSENRTQWFDFSEPYTHSELVFFKSKSLQIAYQSLNDLTPFTIGIVQNYAYPKSFIDHPDLKIDQVLTDEQNMSKLISGRIDMVLIDKRMAHFILRNNHPKKLNSFDSAATLKDESYYLAISKNAKNYKQKHDAFNLGLTKIKENGVLKAIIKKYN